ncbi:uncharacterized protein LOC121854236 [Homarus americanus]|uniref:uncharacterized protein LOC121854236 n=1 Tax=Homarus americanus TaxID=6706 RepID=UPI001C48CC04|nr:uncharacterized protein LOC121854236 [Homarus americanus]
MTQQKVATSLTNLTVCSRVFFTALTKLQVLFSYATADDFSNALMMYIRDGVHFIRYNNIPQTIIETLELPTVLRQWRCYCHVFSGDTYTVYVDGVALASSPIQVDDRVLPLNGTFVVGQEQDSLSMKMNRQQILKGYVTQINMWNYGLSSHEIAAVANCFRNIIGNIFSADLNEVELINVEEEKRSLKSFCFKEEKFIIFPEKRIFVESTKFCRRVGSQLYAPLNREMNTQLNATMVKLDICGGAMNMWIGVTDEEEEGTWRRITDGKVLENIPFAGGQPDNTRAENCMMMVGDEGSWADFKCYEKNEACVSCEERPGTTLYLRGTCQDMRTSTMFENLGYYSQKPYFHGFHGYMIRKYDSKKWILHNTETNSTLAYLSLASSDQYPLGRQRWSLAAPICHQPEGSERDLSLSICEAGQYMCDDGQCIDLAARCDAKDDCDDETDEDNCSILQIPAGYRSFKPPKNIANASQPLQPHIIFKFLRFLNIADVQQAIHLEFIVTMSWMDSRLKYRNLRSIIHANKLSSEEKGSIWRPELEFPNVKDGQLNLLKENVFVQKVDDSLPVDFNVVNMDKMYGGSAALIIQHQHYSGSFVCTFDVFYYPFDVQRCGVMVQLSSLSKELVAFTKSRAKVEYDQDKNLPTYIISDFYAHHKTNTNRESLLEVGYTLTRRYTLIVLSVFMPSTMLLTIGYSTLYVKVQLLQVRLVVSLTTLLVLYTFFNQTSSSLPQTAYVKMIDVWFFSCTILLFVIIIVHVFVECLESEAMIRVGPKFSPLPSRLTPDRLLRLFRLVLVPVAAFVFTVVYFTMLLT